MSLNWTDCVLMPIDVKFQSAMGEASSKKKATARTLKEIGTAICKARQESLNRYQQSIKKST